ncbi:MAG: phosphonoacetaldehyde reductase [Coriobacteriales bacterium]|jgi:alcohol dehydrogenase class IV
MDRREFGSSSVFIGDDAYEAIADVLSDARCILLVHGRSYARFVELASFIESLPARIVHFTGYSPNPLYEEALEGRKLFLSEGCDAIVTVGGGSAIDTAKAIKLFSAMADCDDYLAAPAVRSAVSHVAVPTTAGTGSEGNGNIVLYRNGVKQSLHEDFVVPEYAVLVPALVKSLPDYQKKSTALDAYCQCFESLWAVAATDESRRYAAEGLRLLDANIERYFDGDVSVAGSMQLGAHYSGRAIDISKTTAAHAMSYKLSSMYGIAHGHAVALTLPHICALTVERLEEDGDATHGKLRSALQTIRDIISPDGNWHDVTIRLFDVLGKAAFAPLAQAAVGDISILVESVNPVRLGNNPLALDERDLNELYRKVFFSE